MTMDIRNKKQRNQTVEKVAILASYDKLPKIRQCYAAEQLKVSQPILSIIIIKS